MDDDITLNIVDQVISINIQDSGANLTLDLNSVLSAPVAGFIYQQTEAATSWTVNHNLGRYPAVNILNAGSQAIIGDIVHTNTNQLIVSFSMSLTGKVICV